MTASPARAPRAQAHGASALGVAADPAAPSARALLAAFERLRPTPAQGLSTAGAGLFSYCALSRERLTQVRLDHPVLGIVLSGAKEIWRGLTPDRLEAGTLFALPGQVPLEIVNEPDARRGLYQSLIFEVSPDLVPPELFPPGPSPRLSPAAGCAIALRPGLIEALAHAASAIAAGPAAAAVRQARIAEVLALVADAPAAAVLFELPLGARIAQMVRAHPDRPWTGAQMARALGLSGATLRRRLAAEGMGFAAIVRRERMQLAAQMLARGLPSGLVAATVGYASRTHFARAYRAETGRNPRRDQPPPA